jgi:hypothetical protein
MRCAVLDSPGARVAGLAAALLVTAACAGGSGSDDADLGPTTPAPAEPAVEPDACAERERADGDGAVVDDLLALFDATPIVAFGEHHGADAEHRILQALVCDPRFADTVDAVVVEFGNLRFQDVLDRYTRGDDVGPDELAAVWRETTQRRSGVWDDPVYRQFFAVVRSANRGRPPEQQVRVLAGDPPVDWATITDTQDCDQRDPSCLEHWDREASFVEVVRREVLVPGRTALLVAGAGHMARRLEPGPPPSIPQALEATDPGSVTIVLTHERFLGDDPVAAAALPSGSAPALVPLAGSPLGATSLCAVDDGPGCDAHTLAELADAYLFPEGGGAPTTTTAPRRTERRGSTPVVVGEPIDIGELGGRIVFDDVEDVFSMRPDGTGVRAVTTSEGPEFDAAWSPDGQFVVYRDSRRGINEDDEIVVARADGTEPRDLTNHPANDWGPDWSPDGQWIVFNSDRDGGALRGYLVRPDGTDLTPLPVDVWFEYPSFSPDGTRVAFMSHGAGGYDVYVAELTTGVTTRLTDAPGSDGWPAWSPDGSTIAFTSERDDCAVAPPDQDCWNTGEPGDHHSVWLVAVDGSDERRVTPEHGQFVAWAPDGRHLLVSGEHLYVLRPDGTGRVELRAEGIPHALGGIPDWTAAP